MNRTLYDILGLSSQATSDEVKSAHHRLALEWHPDKNSSTGAKEKFLSVQYAYEVLSNSGRRKYYDIALKNNNTKIYDEQQIVSEKDIFDTVNGNSSWLSGAWGDNLKKSKEADQKIKEIITKKPNERTEFINDRALLMELLIQSSGSSFAQYVQCHPVDLLKKILNSEPIMCDFARSYNEVKFKALLWNCSASERWSLLQYKPENNPSILEIIYSHISAAFPKDKPFFEAFILDPKLYFQELSSLIDLTTDKRLSGALTALKNDLYKNISQQQERGISLIDIQHSEAMEVVRSTINLVKCLHSNSQDSVSEVETYYQKHLSKPNQFQNSISKVLLLTIGFVCGLLLTGALLMALSPILLTTTLAPLYIVAAFGASAVIGTCIGIASLKCIPLSNGFNKYGLFNTQLQRDQKEIVDAAKHHFNSDENSDQVISVSDTIS